MMRTPSYLSTTLLLTIVATIPTQAAESQPGPIQDNSFLVEEAYNQEAGVVQHINVLQRSLNSEAWLYTFTQEWPVSSQAHQFSYTIPVARLDAASDACAGFGDVGLNYRYQLLGSGETPVAVAPRATLLLPTGSYRRELGVGAAGYQAQIPLSWTVTESLVSHTNLGATYIPRARGNDGARANLTSWNAGQSLIWLAHPRFNVMVEWVYIRAQSVIGAGTVATESITFVSPGIRWAHNFASGLQIVPGIAFPIGVGTSRGDNSVIFYLSFEHPFRRQRSP